MKHVNEEVQHLQGMIDAMADDLHKHPELNYLRERRNTLITKRNALIHSVDPEAIV